VVHGQARPVQCLLQQSRQGRVEGAAEDHRNAVVSGLAAVRRGQAAAAPGTDDKVARVCGSSVAVARSDSGGRPLTTSPGIAAQASFDVIAASVIEAAAVSTSNGAMHVKRIESIEQDDLGEHR
jgi:hypothetical protein